VTNGCNKVVESLVDDSDGKIKNDKFSCSRLKGCYSDIEGIFNSLVSCNKNCSKTSDGGTHNMFGCSKGKCKPMKYGKWDTMNECLKFDNTCGDKYVNSNDNGLNDKIRLYNCSEGICFEDSKGVYTSIEQCVTACSNTYIEYKPTEVVIAEDRKRELVDRKDIADCEKGYYWCDTIKRCIPNKMECPKRPEIVTKINIQ
jgi:hypothetical protein